MGTIDDHLNAELDYVDEPLTSRMDYVSSEDVAKLKQLQAEFDSPPHVDMEQHKLDHIRGQVLEDVTMRALYYELESAQAPSSRLQFPTINGKTPNDDFFEANAEAFEASAFLRRIIRVLSDETIFPKHLYPQDPLAHSFFTALATAFDGCALAYVDAVDNHLESAVAKDETYHAVKNAMDEYLSGRMEKLDAMRLVVPTPLPEAPPPTPSTPPPETSPSRPNTPPPKGAFQHEPEGSKMDGSGGYGMETNGAVIAGVAGVAGGGAGVVAGIGAADTVAAMVPTALLPTIASLLGRLVPDLMTGGASTASALAVGGASGGLSLLVSTLGMLLRNLNGGDKKELPPDQKKKLEDLTTDIREELKHEDQERAHAAAWGKTEDAMAAASGAFKLKAFVVYVNEVSQSAENTYWAARNEAQKLPQEQIEGAIKLAQQQRDKVRQLLAERGQRVPGYGENTIWSFWQWARENPVKFATFVSAIFFVGTGVTVATAHYWGILYKAQAITMTANMWPETTGLAITNDQLRRLPTSEAWVKKDAFHSGLGAGQHILENLESWIAKKELTQRSWANVKELNGLFSPEKMIDTNIQKITENLVKSIKTCEALDVRLNDLPSIIETYGKMLTVQVGGAGVMQEIVGGITLLTGTTLILMGLYKFAKLGRWVIRRSRDAAAAAGAAGGQPAAAAAGAAGGQPAAASMTRKPGPPTKGFLQALKEAAEGAQVLWEITNADLGDNIDALLPKYRKFFESPVLIERLWWIYSDQSTVPKDYRMPSDPPKPPEFVPNGKRGGWLDTGWEMTARHALEKAKNRHLACATIGIVAGSSIHKTYVHSMQHHLGDLLDFGGKSVFRLDPDVTAREPYFCLFRSDATYDGTERANLNNVLRYGVKPIDIEEAEWNGLIMAPLSLEAFEAARAKSMELVPQSPAVAPRGQTPAARNAAQEHGSGGARRKRHNNPRHNNPRVQMYSRDSRGSRASVVDEVFAEFELRQLRLSG